MTNQSDAIVIGGGITGLSTAYHLTREGKRVLLLEQFPIGHERGQSYGETRMLSLMYKDEKYVRLNLQAKQLWREFEQDAGLKIFFETGGIDMGEDSNERASLLGVRDTMHTFGIAYEEWDSRAIREKVSVWRPKEEAFAIYSPGDGIISPMRAVAILVSYVTSLGCAIRDEEPVTGVFSDGSSAEVFTGKNRYTAKNLVIACGVWTNKVLSSLNFSLPIQPTQEQIAYFIPRANMSAFFAGYFPMFFHRLEPIVYGFPIFGGRGIKIAFHGGGMRIDVDSYTGVSRSAVTERLRAYLEKYLPDAAGESFGERTCLYDNTPDQDFIIDQIPEIQNIFVGAGFNGNGFAPSMAVGRALSDLVLHGKTDVPISQFSIKRFV